MFVLLIWYESLRHVRGICNEYSLKSQFHQIINCDVTIDITKILMAFLKSATQTTYKNTLKIR